MCQPPANFNDRRTRNLNFTSVEGFLLNFVLFFWPSFLNGSKEKTHTVSFTSRDFRRASEFCPWDPVKWIFIYIFILFSSISYWSSRCVFTAKSVPFWSTKSRGWGATYVGGSSLKDCHTLPDLCVLIFDPPKIYIITPPPKKWHNND